MAKPTTQFEKQVLQIASLGVWQIVTGHPMKKQLDQVSDDRWNSKEGLFVTLKKDGAIRGSMGMFESSTMLSETLFNTAQTAATHDRRYGPIEEQEIPSIEIEVTLLSAVKKLRDISDLVVGTMGLIVSRGENQAVLLPHIAVELNWNSEQFVEACCEKAHLSHKAWKDPNTLVETFSCQLLEGGRLLKNIEEFI